MELLRAIPVQQVMSYPQQLHAPEEFKYLEKLIRYRLET